MFTDPRFLSYSNLLYLDADGLVSAPIIPAFKALRHSNLAIIMRENGVSFGKDWLWQNELKTPLLAGVPNVPNPGASCLMLIATDRLEALHLLQHRLDNLICSQARNIKYADQSVILLAFHNEYGVSNFCGKEPMLVYEPQRKSIPVQNCSAKVYAHDYRKQCAKLQPLSNASARAPARRVGS